MNPNSLSITLAVLVAEGLVPYERAEACQKALGDKIVPHNFSDVCSQVKEALSASS